MDRSFTQYDRFLRLIGGHMNFRKLLTYLTVGTAAVIPFAGAQNPTILQGSYISNVFGNSNFVLNPNAQTNVANVTNATRSIATPLVATSEFNLNLTSGTFATWTLRAFDAGMKGQNCEARFSYRGFATATSTAQIVQNSLVVAQLVLTPSTDPRIASINFPCGDLANATTFRIAQTTANMTTVTPNEIGGIYVGLATNMANVAQAETVVIANVNAQITIPTVTYTNVPYQSESLDAYGEYNNSTGVFTAKRAGNYFIAASMFWLNSTWGASNIYLNVYKNGSLIVENLRQIPAGTAYHLQESSVSISLSVGDTLVVSAYQNDTANRFIAGNSSFSRLSISRFPSASELVVTPERQNTFGAVQSTTGSATVAITSATLTSFNSATIYSSMSYKGKATALQTGTCGTTNDAGLCMPTLAPGTYKVSVATNMFLTGVGPGNLCQYTVSDGTQTFGKQNLYQALANEEQQLSNIVGIFTYTSVQTNKPFTLQAARLLGGGNCNAALNSSGGEKFTMVIEPLDQPSNSALYVQGPVKSAGTGTASAAGYQGEEVSGTSTAGTGTNCAEITVNPGQWILYGMGWATISAISGSVFYDIEIEDASGVFSAGTGSFMRTIFNVNGEPLLSSTRVVRTTTTRTYYLNCRVAGIGGGSAVKTNNTSVFKAVRLN